MEISADDIRAIVSVCIGNIGYSFNALIVAIPDYKGSAASMNR
jgi:hypothetical protein